MPFEKLFIYLYMKLFVNKYFTFIKREEGSCKMGSIWYILFQILGGEIDSVDFPHTFE